MMGTGNFSDEFKRDVVAQITERGYPVAEVSKRLGVSQHSLYAWKRKFSKPSGSTDGDQAAEIRRLKRELARVPEERDILKKSHSVFRQGCKVRYAFVAEHRQQFTVRAMCRCLRIRPGGFYSWLKNLLSRRVREDRLSATRSSPSCVRSSRRHSLPRGRAGLASGRACAFKAGA